MIQIDVNLNKPLYFIISGQKHSQKPKKGINLVNKDTFSKSDPFFEIRFLAPNSTKEINVYRSEVLDDNLSPDWAPFIIHKDQLCAGDDRKKVKIVVFDFDGPEKF